MAGKAKKRASQRRVSNKIKKVKAEGKPQKQAIAIALSIEKRRKK